MASTSRAGLCAGCSNPAKYKCPRCAYPSCSLACSTAHKTATSCSGIALPVHAQAIQATEWGWGPMMRDQSYISSVSRKAEELGKQLAADKLLPARNAGEGRLDERNDKEDLLVREARAEGVDLVLLPKGMSRRARNASRWDYKGKKVDWTTEILLHPPSAKDPRAPPQQPLIVTNQPLPSTTTLYFLLKAAMDTRDRKGKGKELDEEDAKLRSEQKAWLETFAPLSVPQPAEAVEVPPADAREDAKLSAEASPPQDGSTAPSADPPFVILSPVVAIPPRISSSSHDDDELSTSTTAPPATSTTTPRPSSKSYYTMSPSDTLRKSLVGTTLIEYPTFEIWSREAFLRARALGAIAVAEKPESLPQLPQGAFSSTWERGRGRGRGGGGRGGSRGGRGGGRGASHGGLGDRLDADQSQRVQDSGWGKRGIAAVEGDMPGVESKRSKVEDVTDGGGAGDVDDDDDDEGPEVDYEVLKALVADFGDGGLVDYDSD